jgi:hypothetical protein
MRPLRPAALLQCHPGWQQAVRPFTRDAWQVLARWPMCRCATPARLPPPHDLTPPSQRDQGASRAPGRALAPLPSPRFARRPRSLAPWPRPLGPPPPPPPHEGASPRRAVSSRKDPGSPLQRRPQWPSFQPMGDVMRACGRAGGQGGRGWGVGAGPGCRMDELEQGLGLGAGLHGQPHLALPLQMGRAGVQLERGILPSEASRESGTGPAPGEKQEKQETNGRPV